MEALKRWTRSPKGKAWGPIVVACAVGAAVFWEVRSGLAAKARGLSDPRYLIAARDLSEGLSVSFSDLTFRFAQSSPVPSGAITDQELHLLSDSQWARPVRQGEWVTWGVLRPAPAGLGTAVPKGMRAHGVEFDASPPVFPKDRIDVFWNSDDPRQAPAALVEGVQVLRVRREAGRQAVVLALHPDDIPVLEKAAGGGKLSLSVRNPEEAPASGPRRRPPFGRKSSPHRRIEIWTEKS